VQFDYGLRQGRSRALANRPDSFVSAEGKVIMVDKKVAGVNEKVLERGRVRVLFSNVSWVTLLTGFPPLFPGTLVCSQRIRERITPRTDRHRC